MVKKFALGHPYKWQRWASNPHCDSKVCTLYHHDRVPPWRSAPHVHPGYCSGVRIVSPKSYHVTWSLRIEENFLKCYRNSLKLSKKNSQEETQKWGPASNSHTGMREGMRGFHFLPVPCLYDYSIKVVSPPPIRKPQRYHHVMTLSWEQGHRYQMSKWYITPAALWDHVL